MRRKEEGQGPASKREDHEKKEQRQYREGTKERHREGEKEYYGTVLEEVTIARKRDTGVEWQWPAEEYRKGVNEKEKQQDKDTRREGREREHNRSLH